MDLAGEFNASLGCRERLDALRAAGHPDMVAFLPVCLPHRYVTMVAKSAGNERACDGGRPSERPSERPTGAAWSAGARTGSAARTSAKLLISLVLAGSLGALTWQRSGTWFQDAARQRVADRWSELRHCLLGDGRAPTTRPSRRLHDIELVVDEAHATWPARCKPYAHQLDAELSTRSMRALLGSLPSATAIVQQLAGAELDTLHDALEAPDNTPTSTVLLNMPCSRNSNV